MIWVWIVTYVLGAIWLAWNVGGIEQGEQHIIETTLSALCVAFGFVMFVNAM